MNRIKRKDRNNEEEAIEEDKIIEKEKPEEKEWLTYDEFKKYFTRFTQFFIWNNWTSFIIFLILVIEIILEIIFRLVNDQYGSRPSNWYTSLLSPLLLIGPFFISILLIRYLYKKFFEERDKIINDLNISYVPTESYKPREQKLLFKLGNEISIFLIPIVFSIVALTTELKKIFSIGVGVYFPNTPIGYFMIIYKIMIFILFAFILTSQSMIFNPISFQMEIFRKRIDEKKIILKPSNQDPSGGFKEIGLLAIKIFGLISCIYLFYSILLIIEFFGNIHIFEQLSQQTLNNSEYPIGIIIFLILMPLLNFLLNGIVNLIPYNQLLKRYKNYQLQLLFKKKNLLISKSLKKANINIAEKDMKTLQKIDYLIKEIESISNWPISFKFYASIFSSSLLPGLIALIITLLRLYS